MTLSLSTDKRTYRIDFARPLSIAIALRFDGPQPNAYGVAKASAEACRAGSLVGDTRRGGSCNFEEYRLIPHCNGTHTESVGHLTHARISVHDCLRDAFAPAVLVSIEPEAAAAAHNESYAVELSEDDRLITRRSLEKALDGFREQIADFVSHRFPLALVVRTLPNGGDKPTRTYLETAPPFFSGEAIGLINEIGVRHLLADLPSIDRIFDDGKLANHRLFWGVEPGAFEIADEGAAGKTVTELIFADDKITDGLYLLNLQIAPFAADASPSRPILFPLFEQ